MALAGTMDLDNAWRANGEENLFVQSVDANMCRNEKELCLSAASCRVSEG